MAVLSIVVDGVDGHLGGLGVTRRKYHQHAFVDEYDLRVFPIGSR